MVLFCKVSKTLKWGATIKTCLAIWLQAHLMKVQAVFSLPRANLTIIPLPPRGWLLQKRRGPAKYSRCWNRSVSSTGTSNLLIVCSLHSFNSSRLTLQRALFLEYVVSGFGINLFLRQSTRWASLFVARTNTIPSDLLMSTDSLRCREFPRRVSCSADLLKGVAELQCKCSM